ncbi:MAG: 5-oxoprolinase subunit PxpB [Porticoccaceae bacterium]|nr:5-oxoprolinase subunit PxpB [Porticoccaceae bacterium]
MSTEKTISIAAENALIVYFSDHPSAATSAEVAHTVQKLTTYLGATLIDLVPSYASLLVIFDPFKTDHHSVRRAIHRATKIAAKDLNKTINTQETHNGSLVTLPVYYSSESGPDLQRVADRAGLSIAEVIAIHQQTEYRVYAIGFAPGFAYLGEVDARIATPRLATPRQQVPRGAVAIADQQTAVYPAQSPGGWNLIGLCPQLMFDPKATPSMPVAVGDLVRFEAIDKTRFENLGGVL